MGWLLPPVRAGVAHGPVVARENILFDQFGYGLHVYTEARSGLLNNIELDGNVAFNNGTVSAHPNASNILVFNVWKTAFVYFQMGYAAAMSYILFVVVLGFTALQWVLQRRWVHY